VPRAAYHFAGFVVSRARRQLLRDGREVPLIPRYFDLLLVLIERRAEAVHRHELLEHVWSDVVVSDNALNQAVRTLRRALGDDPRQPTYIRTAARHGYQFVYADVSEREELALPAPANEAAAGATARGDGEFDRALTVLSSDAPDEERRDAAAALLRLDADRARRALESRGDAARALATLRDARWEVPGAAPVPFLGRTGMWRSGLALARLRLGELWPLARRRWLHAVSGGVGAGAIAGVVGGAALWLGPGATGSAGILLVLPLLGAILGGLGAFGVAGGLTLAEVAFRAARAPALVAGGAAGGAAIGALCHGLAALLLQGLFGKDLSAIAGGFEGLAIGAAVGVGYAVATPRESGGLATPSGIGRFGAALLAGAICAATTGLLAWNGSFLGAMSLDLLATSFPGSEVGLAPIARLLGEESPGMISSVVVSGWEGLAFGTGVILGLTHRPRV
jgi:DNA-binding winged helix-turn-helix (wHTH) protein